MKDEYCIKIKVRNRNRIKISTYKYMIPSFPFLSMYGQVEGLKHNGLLLRGHTELVVHCVVLDLHVVQVVIVHMLAGPVQVERTCTEEALDLLHH